MYNQTGEKGVFAVCGKIKTVFFTHWFTETLIAENIDPIEKKTVFHVLSRINIIFHCCCRVPILIGILSEHEISQMPRSTLMITGEDIEPAQIVARANKSGSKTIRFILYEPTVYFESAYETAQIAQGAGHKKCLC